ncbi:MAG: XrtA system polysaccharide chain length determinant [Desulfuromonadales bacterium]
MERSSSEIMRNLRVLYKKRYLGIATALVVMSLVIGYSYTMPKQYKADSTVFIESNVINSLVEGIAITPSMDDRIRVLRYAMLSRDLISKVLKEMDLDAELGSEARLQDYVEALQTRTKIDFRNREGLFTVSIVDGNPVFARDYVNTLVRTYVEENISEKREETYGANRFLDEQLIHFKQKLDEAEDAIIEFRRQQGVFLAVGEQAILQDIQTYQREIEDITLTMETLEARKAQLAQQLKNVKQSVPIFNEQQGADRIVSLEQRIAQLLLTYTENYPEVIRLKAEVEGLKRHLQSGQEGQPLTGEMTTINPVHQEVQQNIFNVEAELSSLKARKESLLRMMEGRKAQLQDVPENRKVLAALEQERDSYRQTYDQLLTRMGQSEVSKQMEISNKASTFRIVDPAQLPKGPESPNMVRMILLAIAAGLGSGAGLILLLDRLNPTIVEVAQIRELGVEVLAVIPTIVDSEQLRVVKRRDALIYSVSGVYFSAVLGLLAFEALLR